MTDKYRPVSLVNFYNAIDSKFKSIEDVSVIFDIGSLHCLESVEFSKKFIKANVYAFEANKTSYQVCLENTEGIDRIAVTNKCINDYDGICKFYPIDPSRTVTPWFDGNRGASSMFKANGAVDHIEKYVQDEIDMECIRLESFCKENKIEKVDAIWMDLQGAELLALKGLGPILDTVQVIQTELEMNPMYENQCLFNDVNTFLTEKGFYKIDGNTEAEFGADFIYIRK
jgi:FkbM family methyltransferase